MMRKHYAPLLVTTFTLLLALGACRKSSNTPPTSSIEQYGNKVPTAWMDMETRLVSTTPGYTPPIASRALGYTGLALYETVSPAVKNWRSAHDAFAYNYVLPAPNGLLNWDIAANAAMKRIILYLFENTSSANKVSVDSLYEAQLNNYPNEDPAIKASSIAFGNSVADAIYQWSRSDGGDKAYNHLYPSGYTLPAGPGMWEATPPAMQQIPMLPDWGNNRPFLANNMTSPCLPSTPIPFSTDAASDYHAQVMEVYNTGISLTDEQKSIAKFWADDAKSFTPPGHLMNIATQMLREENASLSKAAEVYLRMGLAEADAFIACWKTKYTYNCCRPVTYIRKNIDPNWMPYINTPPFPEYASGHSTVSGAAAVVLTAMFGSKRFTDHTNASLGLGSRSFNSFDEAAAEAAMSRLYGGIHYRNSNDNAMVCGRLIGKNTMAVQLH